jgi:hypothetical protein
MELPSEGRGREFESRRARHVFKELASAVQSARHSGKHRVSKRKISVRCALRSAVGPRARLRIASHRPVLEHATNSRPRPRRQFEHCPINPVVFVESNLDGALPRRSDGLQTGVLASEACCNGPPRSLTKSPAAAPPLTSRYAARGAGGCIGQGGGGGYAVCPGTRLTYRSKFSGAGGRKRKWPQLFTALLSAPCPCRRRLRSGPCLSAISARTAHLTCPNVLHSSAQQTCIMLYRQDMASRFLWP